MRRVFVVAWHYDGGAGFDWYVNAEAADKAFEEEKKNADEFKADEWEAYRFDFDAGDPLFDSITSEIDANIDNLSLGMDERALNRKVYRAFS